MVVPHAKKNQHVFRLSIAALCAIRHFLIDFVSDITTFVEVMINLIHVNCAIKPSSAEVTMSTTFVIMPWSVVALESSFDSRRESDAEPGIGKLVRHWNTTRSTLLRPLAWDKQAHLCEKAVVCDQCGKKFGYRWLLILHQRTHSQERPHQCPVCSRAFCKKQDMKRHHLTHTSIKSFECTTCNMLFRRKDNLERHLKNTHLDQTKTRSSKLEPHHIKDKPPNLPRPPPRCLEDLLDLPSSVQSSNSSTHCSDTQAVQINNALMFKQIEPQTKNKGGKDKQLMEGTKTKESQPSFRQIIYSNFQINDSFKQIPVLDTQDKTVICKAMSVINRPAATPLKEAPVENTTKCVKTVSVVRNAKKTYSDKRMHTYNEAANCVRTITRVPELLPKDPEPPQIKYSKSSQKQLKNVEKPQPCEENFDKHITNIPNSIHCKNKQTDIQKELEEIPSKMVDNYSEPVLTVLPEHYKCPLTVDVNFDEPYIMPVTNVIKSCGQPSVLKVLHDLHWRKRTMEMLKQRQYLSPDIENAYG
uniref:C2H2-type domain-containing protein n=1 Tax=Timema tahoe TaxID=61484 RepID=A0A7R9FHQ9_9NEOP|nr:unnamed protein product [Timema tahoe]